MWTIRLYFNIRDHFYQVSIHSSATTILFHLFFYSFRKSNKKKYLNENQKRNMKRAIFMCLFPDETNTYEDH